MVQYRLGSLANWWQDWTEEGVGGCDVGRVVLLYMVASPPKNKETTKRQPPKTLKAKRPVTPSR